MSDRAPAVNIRHTANGRIEIAPRAISTVAAAAVTRVYGVVGMAPRNLRESVVQVLRTEDQHKGIDIHADAAAITIDLYVVVEYGTRIATVARNIMDGVKYAVEQALGLPVAAVNVHVQGLRVGDHGSHGRG